MTAISITLTRKDLIEAAKDKAILLGLTAGCGDHWEYFGEESETLIGVREGVSVDNIDVRMEIEETTL